MVPDELAVHLAVTHSDVGKQVLDPFCGSGRLLMAAAARGAECVGFDINPLACLLTEAKSARVCATSIAEITAEASRRPVAKGKAQPIILRGNRQVAWYSDQVAVELQQILRWINSLGLGGSERLVVAAALSAAARDSSWCRKNGWKLHRLSVNARESHRRSAWTSFVTRLQYYVNNAESIPLKGTVGVTNRSITALATGGEILINDAQYDLILTSPPYGDSKTTVQYGAASALCLDVVSRISGLESFYADGSNIDSKCLGSRRRDLEHREIDFRKYWPGDRENEAHGRVQLFLDDFAIGCEAMDRLLKPGGVAILIVGRRCAGGLRLDLDRFAIDKFGQQGIKIVASDTRSLVTKRLPKQINRYARSRSDDRRKLGTIQTMSEEIVLTFRK